MCQRNVQSCQRSRWPTGSTEVYWSCSAVKEMQPRHFGEAGWKDAGTAGWDRKVRRGPVGNHKSKNYGFNPPPPLPILFCRKFCLDALSYVGTREAFQVLNQKIQEKKISKPDELKRVFLGLATAPRPTADHINAAWVSERQVIYSNKLIRPFNFRWAK